MDNGTFVAATGTGPWTYSWPSTSVTDGIHSLTARATDTSGLSSTTFVNVTVSNSPGGGSGDAAGVIPFGLPSRFTVGLYEENTQTWMSTSGVRWDTRYRYFVNGWVNNWGWGNYDGSWGLAYLQQSDSMGFMPVVQYVMNGIRTTTRARFWRLRRTLQDG